MTEWRPKNKGFIAEGTVYGKCAVVWGTNPVKQAKVPTGATLIIGVVQGAAREVFATLSVIDVAIEGIVEMCTTAAVITAGQLVYVDTAGRATAQGSGAATQYCIGVAQSTSGSTLDNLVEVLLVPTVLVVHA